MIEPTMSKRIQYYFGQALGYGILLGIALLVIAFIKWTLSLIF